MTLRLVLAALLCSSPVGAEESFGTRHQIVPFGGISFAHGSGSGSSTSLSIAPGAMWFVTDNLAIGAQAGFGWRSASGSVVINGVLVPAQSTTTKSLSLSPVVATALPVAGQVAFFPQLSAGFSWSWFDPPAFASPSPLHAISLGVYAPLVFTPASHVYFGLGPFFGWLVDASSNSGNTAYGLQSQIGVWF